MPAKRDLDPGASPLHFFGAEVRRAREAAGMTLADLGAVVPCDASTVSKIEAGQLRPTQRFVTACIETCPQLEWLGRFHEDSQLWGDGAIPRWFEDWLKAERAVRTMISAPCSTVWVPWNMFRPVAVYPSSTALTRICGNALAYWMVSMFTAAFDAGWATPGYAAAGGARRGHPRHRAEPAAHVHDDRRRGPQQQRQERVRHPYHPEDIRLEDRPDRLPGQLSRAEHPSVRLAPLDPRVVDQHVKTASGIGADSRDS